MKLYAFLLFVLNSNYINLLVSLFTILVMTNIYYNILINFCSVDLSQKLSKEFEEIYSVFGQKEKILCLFYEKDFWTSDEMQARFESWSLNEILRRLTASELIDKFSKVGRNYEFKITEKGQRHIEKYIIDGYLSKKYEYKEYKKDKAKQQFSTKFIDCKEEIKIITEALIEYDYNRKGDDKYIIDLQELAKIDIKAVDYIYSDFVKSISIIESYVTEELTNKINKDKIRIINAHESSFMEIPKIDREDSGLIYTKGLLTTKKETINSKITSIEYLCTNPSCNYSQDKIKTNHYLKLKSCPKCKSALDEIKQDRTNILNSKITDIESNISFPLWIQGSLAQEFSYLELGDEIEVIGHLEEREVEKSPGEFQKFIVVNSFNKIENIKKLSVEETQEIEQIINSEGFNLAEYLVKPFKYYIEDNKIKELFIYQQLSRQDKIKNEIPLSIALMGEPGIGKNFLISIMENFFPHCESVSGADITDAGFKGTVNRDTGIKEIGMAKKLQGGTIIINEFDKYVKTNPNGKKGASQMFNSSITEQEIRLNKAGIKMKYANLDLRHNIVFNPLEEDFVKKQKLPYDAMSEVADKSLLSRMIPIYISRDEKRSFAVFDNMLERNYKVEEINKDQYAKLILYLRNKEVELGDSAKEKLKEVFKDFLKSDTNKVISVERIGQILIQLGLCIAKFRNKNIVDSEDIKKATEVYFYCLQTIGINYKENLEKLFLTREVKEIKTITEIKNYLIKELEYKDNEYLKIEELETIFNKDLLHDAIGELKRDFEIMEPRKGSICLIRK